MKYSSFQPAATLAACATVLALAACGGGGDGGDSAPAVKSVDVAAFEHNILRVNAQWTLNGTGTANGKSVPFQIVMSSAPAARAAFPLTGVIGNTVSQSMTISASGVSQTVIGATYYDDADHSFGVSYDTGGCTSIVASATALPTAAAIGSSGPLQTEQSFTSCSTAVSAVPVSTSSETWSVENDGGVILVCENSTQVSGATTATGSTCFESDANGKPGGRARVTISSNGVEINARNY